MKTILYILFILSSNLYAMVDNERIKQIQDLLQKNNHDGWLFYDFRKSDPIALNILMFNENESQEHMTRRWFYFVPKVGDPIKLVHGIETKVLDHLPGEKRIYKGWKELNTNLEQIFLNKNWSILMQYSPNNQIPYVSKVDAGTIDFLRSLGLKIESSASILQYFDATWSKEQLEMHKGTAKELVNVIHLGFKEIKRRIQKKIPTTEWDICQFIDKELHKRKLLAGYGMIISVNANSAMPHYGLTKNQHSSIKENDLVLFDISTKMLKPKAVFADLSWVGFVGTNVPEKYTKIWDVVYKAQQSAFNFVKNSIEKKQKIYGYQVDDIARSIIKENGLGEFFIHRTGHSVGSLHVHGNGAHMDNYETKDNREVIPRTAFSLEPGIYFPNDFGIRSEINVYVDENTAIITAPFQEKIIPILSL